MSPEQLTVIKRHADWLARPEPRVERYCEICGDPMLLCAGTFFAADECEGCLDDDSLLMFYEDLANYVGKGAFEETPILYASLDELREIADRRGLELPSPGWWN